MQENSSKRNNQLIKFFNDLRENLKSPGSQFSSEEVLSHYHSFNDEKKSDFFFETIVFTELNKTGIDI